MSDRQAVVIIHGIGEQKPMDTLRTFTESIRDFLAENDKSEEATVIRSKPDGVSEIYETRRLTLSQSKNRPRTDFYEFYWAHNMRNTLFADTIPWIIKLMTTSPKRIPERLRPVWWTLWGLVVIVVGLSLVVMNNKIVAALVAAATAIPVVVTVLGILQKFVSSAFLSTAGDAARYFTPTPSNIGERNNIRQQGIAFLDKLHEKGYNRIIIVGHSLGSVIGYDLLRLLWTKYHTAYEKKPEVHQDVIEQMNKMAANPSLFKGDVAMFQNLQYLCGEELKNTGNAWRVTDFITLGAAVCSSDCFLGTTTPFSELIEQMEYPVCPPITDREPGSEQKGRIFYHQSYAVEDKKRSIKLLHHAALFAVVRWTNIFFTSDFVGGRADRVFGKGVKDVSIKRKSPWFLPGGHTNYWDKDSRESLKAIAKALRLRTDNNPEPGSQSALMGKSNIAGHREAT